ncbi:hypothetical protein IMSHALPRED_006753 [Imshaugia aleurites]|uniref:Asl1-like glycosyl hydrolase catalytic domain-containing protein n=1 Tax=Imshaugia aleurites TaxID=172621 RepID=A0A8H3FR15_9LECA|nr:hypothetical protein IMSHALPRED_006753 [Imshaugia aleurites]
MRPSLSALALVALCLELVYARPSHGPLPRKNRRQYAGVNWNDPALYKDVDWSTVNYGGGSTPTPTTTSTPAAAPTPAPVAEASPTPSPAAITTSNTNSGTTTSNSGKRGLAYNPSSGNLDIWSAYSQLTWGYNWNDMPQGLPSQFQYVPTLWGLASVHSGNWDSAVKAATSGAGTNYLMSFNEPDNEGQANMDVGSAVAGFNQYMKPYASDNVLLGSPSVTNGVGTNSAGIPQGLDWLSPFLEQCTGCPISFVPIHWYGCQNGCPVSSDVSDFQSHVQSAIAAAVNPATGEKVPVWVTEFQSFTDPESFLSEILPWLDGESGVQRYAYFMATDGILINGGSVNAVGAKYAS